MHIIDSHFHWWPRSVSERLRKRKSYPRAEVNDRGGYTYLRQDGGDYEGPRSTPTVTAGRIYTAGVSGVIS